jgi:hypothetical protein
MKLYTLGLAGFLLCGASAALAADIAPSVSPTNPPAPEAKSAQRPTEAFGHKKFTIRLGAFFPSDSSSRKLVYKTWGNSGLDYAFGSSTSSSPAQAFIYLDSADTSKTALELVKTELGVGYRTWLGAKPGQEFAPYVGFGVGYAGMEALPGKGLKRVRTAGVEGKLIAGIEDRHGLLVQVNYDLTSPKVKANGVKYGFNGLGVDLGYRF